MFDVRCSTFDVQHKQMTNDLNTEETRTGAGVWHKRLYTG
jgi:hypothetical protein